MCPLSKEDIKIILNNCLGNKSNIILSFSISPKSETSLGFMGSHLTLAINFIANDQKLHRKFFVKTHGASGKDNDFLEVTGIFQREADFYRVLVQDMRRSLKEPTWCPVYCYSKNRVLVLEDLAEKGFIMMNGGINLDEIHVEKALNALSRMHAASMLLERRKSNSLISIYPFLFREVLYDENNLEGPTVKWLSWQIKDLMIGIQLLKKYSPREKTLIIEKFSAQIMRIFQLSKKSNKYRNVLTHGDAWKNNLMFHYSKGAPDFCTLVDFQFLRYAPPAYDVMHLLYFTTQKTLRDEKINLFLNLYYESLAKEFETECNGIENELTREEFFESSIVYKEIALIQSLLSMHYILGPATLNIDSNNSQMYEDYLSNHRDEYMKNFFDKESYTNKVTEIFYELIDDYIIKN